VRYSAHIAHKEEAAMTDKASNVSKPRDLPLLVEKDVKIPMRDGSVLVADVFRPDGGDERFPCIMSLGPYQKDKVWQVPHDLEEEGNPYMNWEAPNPLLWCPRGYALVRIDTRGSGKTPGKSEPSSVQEGIDSYDACEWIARQPWCSGRVGALGISYLAAFQWRMANLQPPSLKAIMPWEGRADQYRDQAYHGGIFAMGFLASWHNTQTAHHLLGRPRSYNPDAFNNNLLWEYMRNDLDSEYWRACSAQWDKITVPVYSVGNWGGFSMHLRGNTEAFMCAASKHKKLRIHTGTHFHPFYAEEARTDQLRWFDYWLKELDTGIMDEPPVKLEIRTGGNMKPYPFRFESEWPIGRTRWIKLYLRVDSAQQSTHASNAEGALVAEPPAATACISYPAGAPAHGHEGARNGVSFETAPFSEDTEVTGPLALNLWVSSSSEDMDIYATLRNIGPDGKDVCEIGQRGETVACVTKGWLRASHRKLDPDRSLPYRPYHAHNERWWLQPGVAVECQVEIWPTSMVFQRGHKLRLDITARDGVATQHFTHYNADYNIGAVNTIHAGGDKASWLLLPVIPAK
jgi:predicted acyl esterase